MTVSIKDDSDLTSEMAGWVRGGAWRTRARIKENDATRVSIQDNPDLTLRMVGGVGGCGSLSIHGNTDLSPGMVDEVVMDSGESG